MTESQRTKLNKALWWLAPVASESAKPEDNLYMVGAAEELIRQVLNEEGTVSGA